ncbi:MAG: hypothetical protein DME19_18415, partial [Verrucomicrobia bacterium]
DGDPLSAIVTALPTHGALYQTADGATRGAVIGSVPTVVSNAARQVIYVPSPGYQALDQFAYKVNDGLEESSEAVVTLQANSTPVCVPPPSGLVSWWPGSGDAGDFFGTNNGTVMNGASFAQGKVGKAFSFDGIDDYVQVGTAADLAMTNYFSVSAWILPTGPGTATVGGVIINREGEYEVARFADGTIRWAFANANPGWSYINTGFVAPLYQWTHVCVVYDNGTVNTYANGQLVHTYNGSGPIGDAFSAMNDFRIGGRQEEAQFFRGLIDEVAVFSRALTTAEAAQIYQSGSAGMCPTVGCFALLSGQVAWWPANGNANDLIGANHGTLRNGATFSGGEVDQAFKFNGLGQFVEVPDSDLWAFGTNDFTVELWAEFDSVGNMALIASDEGGGSRNKWILFSTGGGLIFHINSPTLGARDAVQAPFSPAAGVWYHLAVTRRGSSYTIFIDGDPAGTATDSNAIPDAAASLTIGGAEGQFYLNGSIDEVGIYSRALTASEVQSIYNAGAVGACQADLGASVTSLSVPTGNGTERVVTYTIVVTNRGPSVATGITVSDTLPAGVTLVSVASSSGRCGFTNGVVTCALDPLRNNRSATITIVVSEALTGFLTNQVSLAASVFDPATSDNLVTNISLAQPGCVAPPPGLVSWWPGNGNVNDLTGANPGTLQGGVAFSPGMVGQAFSFDGIEDYVSAPDSPSLRVTNLTIEGWFNFAAANGLRSLVTKPLGTGLLDSYALWYQDGVLHAVVSDTTGFGPFLSYSWSPQLGRWYHIAFTFDTANQFETLYVDGSLVAAGSVTTQIAYDQHPLLIGVESENENLTFWFAGQIDEVSLYNRALRPDEIQTAFDGGSGGKCAAQPFINDPLAFPQATVGLAYSQSLTAILGTPPYSFTLASGALPPGMTLAANGTVSGTPTAAGAYTFGVQVTDSAGMSSQRAYTIGVSCVAPPSGLISWWTGDGDAYDLTGANHGTPLGGVAFTPGIVGQAFSFDGASSYVRVPDSDSLRVGSVTIEGWFNFSDAGGLRSLAAKALGTGTADSYAVWYENGVLHGAVSGNGGLGPVLSYGWSPVLHAWYHIAYAFDQIGQFQALYVNGTLVASSQVSIQIAYDQHALLIGVESDNETLSYWFAGQIDEVSLYNRALSAAEIQSIFNAGSAGKCEPSLASAPLIAQDSLRISRIEVARPGHVVLRTATNPTAVYGVTLYWSAEETRRFVVERSTNLIEWTPAPAQVSEVAPGSYQGVLLIEETPACYLRLRHE